MINNRDDFVKKKSINYILNLNIDNEIKMIFNKTSAYWFLIDY